jgi:transcriptional regulator with XRE-family HTH domain
LNDNTVTRKHGLIQGDFDAERGLTAEQAARFAARLTELRLSRNLSERALASAAGLGPTTVRNLLSGKANPRLSTLLALTRALGLSSIEELIGPFATAEFRSLGL